MIVDDSIRERKNFFFPPLLEVSLVFTEGKWSESSCEILLKVFLLIFLFFSMQVASVLNHACDAPTHVAFEGRSLVSAEEA